ncbi:MAG TPA: kinase, partial [Porphyromonadaceae bacterium]|nr:kinase [Porphyromonadaceae bacterium]
GDKGMPDYTKQESFKIQWSHRQDSKANPYSSLSASVNFATSSYERNNLNSLYNPQTMTQSTRTSSVSWSTQFSSIGLSLSSTANLSQNMRDSSIAMTLPDLNISISRFYPFRRKKMVGDEKWYEKIAMSYTGHISNSINTKEDKLMHSSLIKDWRNGWQHQIPISASFTLFKYINVTPNFNFTDRMYTNKIKRSWDKARQVEVADTTYGFHNVYNWNMSVALSTKIYGFWVPNRKIFGDKIQAIRHVLTPSVSYSYAPDFGASHYGYWETYQKTDANGNVSLVSYSPYSNALYGVPGKGKSGNISFSLGNNLEMKVRDDSDSTGVRKVSLIENLTISQSYNFAADSMRWSPIQTSLLLRLMKNFNLSLAATWDPYMYGLTPSGSPVQLNKLRIAHGKFPKLSSTGTSFSYTFNNDTFRKKGDSSSNRKDADEEDDWDGEDGGSAADEDFAATAARRRQRGGDDGSAGTADVDGYEKWECPWSLTFNYSVNYGYGDFNYDKLDYNGKWTQNLSLSGNIRPTKNWNFSFSASYDFDQHKLAYMNCSISRDLHCFTMTASFVPVGPYKSYNFHIAVKSSLLKDVKYDKRSSRSNGLRWY